MKVTVLLKNDHETVKSLFDRFDKGSARNQNGKKELFNEIQRELLIHSQMELEIFYPALAATSSARATELVATAQREHEAVEKLLHELNAMSPTDKSFESRVHELREDVNRHIQMEEEEIFDEARKNLPEFRLEELGLEMEDRRKILSMLAA
ncbi:MAG TPA: hemerythrin domain-containing protein [Terriglobia bacterium]|nr:hemerythrin domain-containing protein [Terriglobia bacterium]